MTTITMARTYVDISQWWKRDESGKQFSVNKIFNEIQGTENEVNRYTLTRAKEGVLERMDLINLTKLTRLCSQWSGKQLTIDDLVFHDEDTED